jgi:hypothetical protein
MEEEMKMNFLLLLLAVTLISCGKDAAEDPTTTTTTDSTSNALATAVTTLVTAANKMDGLQANSLVSSSTLKRAKDISVLASFNDGSEWSGGTQFTDERTNTSTSGKEFMGVQLNPNAARSNGSSISMFGRMKDGLGILCAIGYVLTLDETTGYPSNVNTAVTITSSHTTNWVSVCNMKSSDVSSMVGQNLNIQVTDPSDTTHYDKKLYFSSFGQTYLYRSNSTEIKIYSQENNSNGIHQTLIRYDKSSKVMRMQYISGPNSAGTHTDSKDKHIEAHRLYYDETNDKGYAISAQLDFKDNSLLGDGTPDATEGIRFVLAGKPNASSNKYSLSLTHTSYSSPTNDRDACILGSDGSIDTNGSLCSDTASSLAGQTVSNASALDAFTHTNYDNTNYNAVVETKTLTFGTSDYHTASF